MNSNFFSENRKVISANMENLKEFKQAGFQTAIPYYLFSKINNKDYSKMKDGFTKNPDAVEFTGILNYDKKKNPKLQNLANMTEKFIAKCENRILPKEIKFAL